MVVLPSIYIVGYGPGLAHGIASHFASHNYTIGLVSRSPLNTPPSLPCPPSRVHHALGDASDPSSLLQALEGLKDKLGKPSVVVYNVAGLGLGAKDPLELSWEVLVQHSKLGPGGGLVVGQWAAKELKDREGKKSILFTGGGVAHEVVPGLAGVGIEKSALLNLANNFHAVLKPQAIHVCTISIFNTIQDSDPKYNKDAIAKVYWQAHQDGVERGRSEILY